MKSAVKIVRNLLEGGQIFRRDHACTCDDGGVPGMPMCRPDLQVRLAWRLIGVKKSEYEANNESRLKEQELELMEALRVLISRDGLRDSLG